MSKLKIIALCILFSGCTSIEKLGNESQFQSMLGAKTLLSDALICSIEPREGVSVQNQIVWQVKNNECYIGDTVMPLNEGDTVIVTDIIEVKRLNLFKFQDWYILEYVVNRSQPVEFIYHWGMSTTSPDYPHNAKLPKWK
ncbi:hypothetical protein [Microbulbifer hainanensis]|uniref:hypothetical protein n=1 Tax=Microbulbifer hainanensis TaxID=2735675 RepID=UPI001865D780|nr:hypothetical protein [Microbulbifer hainanensis]